MRSFFIGICGGSASGKTTLAGYLAEALGKKNTNHISLDNYYHDFVRLGFDPVKINYDHPESIDFTSLAFDLKQLKAGNSVDIPVYDFNTHTRTAIRKNLSCKQYIIVEGLFLFNMPLLASLFDVKIYIDTPEEVRLARRIARDTKERNRSPQSVNDQFRRYVRPMHCKFVHPNRALADRIINGDKIFTGQIHEILKLIQWRSEISL